MLDQYGIERVFRVLSINPYLTQTMLWISTIAFLPCGSGSCLALVAP
jgi:hypothetical protein